MELTVKKEIEETVNIELPVFFKHPNEQSYIAALNENNVIKFTTLRTLSQYSNGKLSLYTPEIIEAYKNWNKITEGDFIEIHEDFLKLQSLLPVLIVHDSEN